MPGVVIKKYNYNPNSNPNLTWPNSFISLTEADTTYHNPDVVFSQNPDEADKRPRALHYPVGNDFGDIEKTKKADKFVYRDFVLFAAIDSNGDDAIDVNLDDAVAEA